MGNQAIITSFKFYFCLLWLNCEKGQKRNRRNQQADINGCVTPRQPHLRALNIDSCKLLQYPCTSPPPISHSSTVTTNYPRKVIYPCHFRFLIIIQGNHQLIIISTNGQPSGWHKIWLEVAGNYTMIYLTTAHSVESKICIYKQTRSTTSRLINVLI